MIISNAAIEDVEAATRETLSFPAPPKRKWNSHDKKERFISLFGAEQKVIAGLWALIENDVDKDVELKHLLWALLFLKVYAPNEEAHCAMVGWPTKKEFRQKTWHILETIAAQKPKLIKLSSRFKNAPQSNKGLRKCALLTGDCSDFHIDEPSPWNTKWYSKKFNGPGLKYLVAIAIYSKNICFAEGPRCAGSGDESTFYKQTLLPKLPNEPIEVDSGPGGDMRLMGPNVRARQQRKDKSIVRGRHETIFAMFKHFNVLDTHFHHRYTDEAKMLSQHKLYFDSVAVIIQIKLMMGVNTLFRVPNTMRETIYTMADLKKATQRYY